MGRATLSAVVWDRPALTALSPPNTVAYDARDAIAVGHGVTV